MSRLSKKEKLEAIEIVQELNEVLPIEYEFGWFNFHSTGYIDVITFGDEELWSSEDDGRAYNEELDIYEPMKPFLIKRFKKMVNIFEGIAYTL